MIEDYYKILKIEPNASDLEIKQAFRHLALIYHPDKKNFPNAHELFVQINEAHQVLSDKGKKEQYDFLYRKHILKEQYVRRPIHKEDFIYHNVNKWKEEARKRAEEYSKTKFREFIKSQNDFFNEDLKADGIPYDFNLHKTMKLRGSFPYGRIRFKYLSIPIPRSKR